MTESSNPQTYGIWIPKQGWLRGKLDVFADYDYQKAQQVAKCIGRNAKVLFIDKSIVDLERYYLEHESKQESRSLWHTFKSFFKHKQKR